jgi:proline iminopeptidase
MAAPDAPVIRLHGGPGAYAVSNARFAPLYRDLAAEGFDVYTYDQVGGGLSERLTNPAEYTLERHTADLEAIRKQIGAQQVILLADSWGATLAASYMTAHPERVARVVFTSPAVMDYSEWRGIEWQNITTRLPEAQTRQIDALQSQPRFMAVVFLSQLNPQAAYNLSSDAELDGFFDEWTGKMIPGMVCDPGSYPQEDTPRGFGFWASVMSGSDASLHGRGQRAALAANYTPTLILKGECDYIKWDVAYEYRSTLHNSTLLFIPQAGHAIYYDRPDIYSQAVRAFLLEQPLPIQPYEGSAPPE